ncbi:MAG: hypothetical protein ACXWZW_03470 [Solirubrobacterales bacterium]
MEADRLFDIYLADHLAGSSGGTALAFRIAKENEGSDLGRAMTQIAQAIEEDQRSLERIMQRVGARKRRWRQAGAWLGEKAARLKLNGRLVGYSPLSRLLELEGMIMGVTGKLELWRSLLSVEGGDTRLDRGELESLEKRAEDQRARLEALHDAAAPEALAPGAAARGDG